MSNMSRCNTLSPMRREAKLSSSLALSTSLKFSVRLSPKGMSRNRAVLASVAFLACLTIAGSYKVYRWAVDIHRHDLSAWTLQTLPALGVRLELPVDAAADVRTLPDQRA